MEKLAVLSEMFIAKHPVDAEELKNLGSDDLAVLDMITQNQVHHKEIVSRKFITVAIRRERPVKTTRYWLID